MTQIIFVCGNPPHPIHEKFARSIGADFLCLPQNQITAIKTLFKIKRNYEVYFSEGLFGYLYLLKLLKIIPKKAKTINLFSDPRIYQLKTGIKFNFEKNLPEKYPSTKRRFQIAAIKSLDGAICVGDFEMKLLRNIANIQSRKVEPFINNEEFFKAKISLKDNNILFIGAGPDYYYKGLDFLVKAFEKISNKKSKLYIIGPNWEEFSKKIKNENIVFLGKLTLARIKEYMNKSSLYCHFGRGEAFGISILEAMAAGIPCMVSDETGAKEAVEKVSKSFVLDIKKEKEVVDSIEKYLKTPLSEKVRLGKAFKKQAMKYNEKEGINVFKEEFFRLIDDIDRKNVK